MREEGVQVGVEHVESLFIVYFLVVRKTNLLGQMQKDFFSTHFTKGKVWSLQWSNVEAVSWLIQFNKYRPFSPRHFPTQFPVRN